MGSEGHTEHHDPSAFISNFTLYVFTTIVIVCHLGLTKVPPQPLGRKEVERMAGLIWLVGV